MLEEIIYYITENWKKFVYAFLGFIFSVLLVTIGFWKTLFVLIMTIIGYYLGDKNATKKITKIKKIVIEKINDD